LTLYAIDSRAWGKARKLLKPLAGGAHSPRIEPIAAGPVAARSRLGLNVWFPIGASESGQTAPHFVDIQTDPPPLALAACQRRLSVGLSTAATVVHEPMTVDGAYPETVAPNHPPKTVRNPFT